MNKLITIFLIFFSVSIIAQRTCGTDAKIKERIQTVPGFEAHYKEIMEFIHNPNHKQSLFSRQSSSLATVVTIPVVFHILYKNANQNISEEQIQSQLDVLNRDYRKLNTDFNTVVPTAFKALGADMEIVFCKATKTPTGATTTGITRKSIPTNFSFDNDYYTASGQPAWDTTRYLNIWVGSFTDTSLLGFAYPPSSAGSDDDGLCISYKTFGTTGTALSPFNKGRTATHEIGHYFGLYHPWGQEGVTCGNPYVNDFTPTNDDRVSDTPETNNPYYECPAFPNNTNACTSTANGSMFMNYMEYVNDACMAFFTAGQKTIVRNALSGPRLSLLSSNGCGTLGLNEYEAVNAIAVYPNPVSSYFMITSPQTKIDEVELYNVLGQLVKTQKLIQTNNLINVQDLASGTYYLRIYSEGKFLKSDKVIKE